ncbi:putative ATP-dependent RNA helicase ucp12 [Marasmius crinis-equi]|uniref:ATP-dependent RNA helicase ucp12 n=1 Tax=Marasmius crinis-equi TaxID=585013 RepID=A0ABR3FZT8_9AGAR
MAPRKGKGIVQSGNAGNSSKASKPPATSAQSTNSPDEKPLFPPGCKYPASLLHERCQKNGWEKPIIDTRKQPNGWSFVVTLSKINKKTSQKDTVRMEPHPPYVCPSALEARHWGATYALYRTEHKNAPDHQKWMYEADPFAARKEVEERQARAAEKRAESTSKPGGSSSGPSNEFSQAPEIRMATSLREQVEDAIKQGMSIYPETSDTNALVLTEDSSQQVQRSLSKLGFNAAQASNAVKFLSSPSSMAANLLESLSPLEAAIEYLVLHIPECDLPERFLPTNNSSNPFVTSAHSGAEDLKKRWVEDKAVKVAGWPPHLVKELTEDIRLVNDWHLLVSALGKRLVGDTIDEIFASDNDLDLAFFVDPEEAQSLGAEYEDPNHLVMPLFSAPASLHILMSPKGFYPRPGNIPVYITSPSIPPYVRLHLLSQLLLASKSSEFVQEGEGFCMAAMRHLEDAWASVETDGAPDISKVLGHVLPTRSNPRIIPTVEDDTPQGHPAGKQKPAGARKIDSRTDEQVKAEFQAICRNPKYEELLATRKKLPSFSAQRQFLGLLAKNRVLVVVGETGCGKTTQLPQFIFDSLILSNQGAKAYILVTQPRRLSAIGVAARVSAERIEDGSVGYAIRGESKQTAKTKLLFCTTGVVLRRLSLGDRLKDVTHVVVDEVHERSVDGDFLLLELKELLKQHPNLKVILMSATVNHETFIKYFNGAPLLTIPGFAHPVTDRYLEDIIPKLDYAPAGAGHKHVKDDSEKEALQAKGLDEQSASTITRVSRSERIDYQLIAALVRYIMSSERTKGGVLIFLPGVQEIRQCIDTLKSVVSSAEAQLLPLHANLSSEEQMKVFTKTSGWKLIAATNVAETSITIDDVLYVIDSGKVKETQYDHEANLTKLVETWVTRAAAKQRRGRAGRTQPGTCYKLYTRVREEKMGKFPVPEILRVPLESISLSVKVMREDEDVKLYLMQAIDPPPVGAMEKAWSTLEELGAIDDQGKLTALGRHMSLLPIDLRLAKMLILGAIFRCLGPILTIAACLSSKPLFVSPVDKREEAAQAKLRFATANSDLLTDMHAFDECSRLEQEGKTRSTIKQFCEENFISQTTLREISQLRREFLAPLTSIGFLPLDSTPKTASLNVNSDNLNLIKSIIVGGMWPRIARVHLPKSAIKFDKVQAGTVQRENVAKEYKIYDLREGRVFLHPGSILFGNASWKSSFLVYFQKSMTTKLFLRDATEVPLFAILLFGGSVSVNHVGGGLTVQSKGSVIKLKAWPRIGILVNQLRRLLEAQLLESVERGTLVDQRHDNVVLAAMLSLVTNDGLSD